VAAHVLAVCTGVVRPLSSGGGHEPSGIDKRPREGAVSAGPLGLDGDQQAEAVTHGGIDRALYAYGEADAAHFADLLARPVPYGAFGENLRIAGLDVSGALIGERWTIGDGLEVEVSAPRIPCDKLAIHWGVPDLVERFLAAGRPGAYLRVARPGTVAAGDRVEVVGRPAHGLSVAEVARIRTRAPHDATRLVAATALACDLARWVRARARAD
jgi:MOSC domain-containing protein YiiM